MLKSIKIFVIKLIFILLNSKSRKITINRNKAQKILILGYFGIGNLVFFIPALEVLRKHFQNSKIYFLFRNEKGPAELCKLLCIEKLVDGFFVFDFGNSKFIEKIKFAYKMFKEKFDIVISDFHHRDNGYWAILLSIMRVPIRTGHCTSHNWVNSTDFIYNFKISYDAYKHESLSYFNLIEVLGIKDKIGIPLLRIKKNYILETRKFLKKHKILKDGEKSIVIGIHPGSSKNMKWKRWDEKKFAYVINYLVRNHNAKIFLLGSRDDEDSLNTIIHYLRKLMDEDDLEKYVHDLRSNNLIRTLALIKLCNVFVGNDSGLTKISLALDIPTVTIWGPSNFFRNRSWRTSKSIDLRLNLPCSPCYKIGDTNKAESCLNKACLSLITTKMVISAIEKLLN
jgi:heptosyltransferase-2